MKMKTTTENTKTKMIFLSETESENDFNTTDSFQKLPYLSDNLPQVLPYLKLSPTHAWGLAVGIGSLRPCTSTILNGMLVYV